MRNWVIFAATLLSLVTLCSSGESQVARNGLRNKRITLAVERESLGVVLRHLVIDNDIPIGIELSNSDRRLSDFDFDVNIPAFREKNISEAGDRVQITVSAEEVFDPGSHFFSVNIENGRLEDVLNRIVRQMGPYRWRIDDGVVNIFPSKNRNPVFEKFLSMKISKFTLRNSRIEAIRPKLFYLPEVAAFLKQNSVEWKNSRTGLGPTLRRPLPSGLIFSNISVLELLNGITRIKRGGWILKTLDSLDPKVEALEIDI